MSEDRPKLTRGLVQSLGQVEDSQQQVRIIVRYSSSARVMRHVEPMRGVRRSYNYHLRPFAAMQATPEAIQQLESDPDVVKIYQDLPVHAILDTGLPIVQVPRLWQEGLGGAGVRIAIVDTGIDPAHPDFEGRIAAMTDLTGEGPVDGNGHGTHCAGIAAGSGAASDGKYRGVAPAATLYSAKVLRSDGQGMTSDVMAGVEWAVDQGVQIISLSLGSAGSSDGTDALSELCDAAVEQGIMVCVAAGNEGPGSYTIGSPGASRQALTVGASTDTDEIASFSSRGPTADGRLKPDIVCPGVNIIAPRAKGTAMGTIVNDSYTAASGTSMATPLAAGICALLLEAEPQLTPLEIKARLIGTAVDLGADAYAQGKGRLDAWRARHTEVEPEPTPQPQPPQPSPSPGQGCLTALFSLLFIMPRRQ